MIRKLIIIATVLAAFGCGNAVPASPPRPVCSEPATLAALKERLTPPARGPIPMKVDFSIAAEEAGTSGEWRLCRARVQMKGFEMLDPDLVRYRARWHDDQHTRVDVVAD